VTAREIDGEMLLYDPASRRTHFLNRTAAWIWKQMEAGTDPAELARMLGERFEVAEEEARRDVEDVLAALGERGLLCEREGP